MPHTIVIFGASGDLTSRKLIPAIYRLAEKERLPADTRIVGFSRTPMSDDEWRAKLQESTAEFVGDEFSEPLWNKLSAGIHYFAGDIDDEPRFVELAKKLDELEKGAESTRIYYLATSPQFFEPAIKALGSSGLAAETTGPRRMVIEKPFGTDLASAKRLNVKLHEVFAETQI